MAGGRGRGRAHFRGGRRHVVEGVETNTLPCGLMNLTSACASPSIFHPSSCTRLWWATQRVSRFDMTVRPCFEAHTM